MPRATIDTLKTCELDDRPWPIAKDCLLDALWGGAMLKLGFTPQQAADDLRTQQAARESVEVVEVTQ